MKRQKLKITPKEHQHDYHPTSDLDALDTNDFQSATELRSQIAQAVADSNRSIRHCGLRRES
jgi:hypothetical protein